MIGPDGGQNILRMNRESWGILPRAAEYLIGELADKAQEGQLSYQVKASFLQIYNENLYDLLRESGPMMDDASTVADRTSSNDREHSLKIREIPKSGGHEVYVSGLSEFRVQTSEDVLRIVAAGTANRTTRSTNYNITSSRSHAVLQLTFEIEKYSPSGQTAIYRSKLSLVDLAGSEKMLVTQNIDPSKQHVKELTSINLSLSCLGNVIAALSSQSRTHVPYRDR